MLFLFGLLDNDPRGDQFASLSFMFNLQLSGQKTGVHGLAHSAWE